MIGQRYWISSRERERDASRKNKCRTRGMRADTDEILGPFLFHFCFLRFVFTHKKETKRHRRVFFLYKNKTTPYKKKEPKKNSVKLGNRLHASFFFVFRSFFLVIGSVERRRAVEFDVDKKKERLHKKRFFSTPISSQWCLSFVFLFFLANKVWFVLF